MRIINQEQFAELSKRCGCDCWNPGHVVRQCVKRFPEAIQLRYHVTSGLGVTVEVYTPDGVKTARVHG